MVLVIKFSLEIVKFKDVLCVFKICLNKFGVLITLYFINFYNFSINLTKKAYKTVKFSRYDANFVIFHSF
ncbi:hypothetical protein [Campylobacter geochelonis]|uniref:hypothetical protein n=1 Tax=Campylobacter geochelonis TaxID=1780362 RepID=UPI00094DC63F|nr:hypothetical protein [Campylobacter geochelonis]